MNPFEKILLGVLTTAAQTAPLFVHTPQGVVILNASEALLANILAEFGPKPPAAPATPPAA